MSEKEVIEVKEALRDGDPVFKFSMAARFNADYQVRFILDPSDDSVAVELVDSEGTVKTGEVTWDE